MNEILTREDVINGEWPLGVRFVRVDKPHLAYTCAEIKKGAAGGFPPGTRFRVWCRSDR